MRRRRVDLSNHSFRVAGFALAAALTTTGVLAQSQPAKPAAPANPAPAANPAPTPAPPTDKDPDRASAYYHFTLAHSYEEMATTYGRPEYAQRAIEEYKLALNADPTSKYLNNGLAELYYKTGRVKDAIYAAQEQLKKDPNNVEAHKLLGRVYLRSLGESQNGAPSQQMLDLAIAEYSKIVSLEPKSTEDRLMLGQLFTLNHDSAKAEEQFKAAQAIDPDSEDVVLSLARLYSEQGDNNHAIQILTSLPPDDRTAKTEFALGSIYDQTKDTKKAVEAYRRALDLDPDNLDTERALGQTLLNDGQLSDALRAFKDVAAGDPQDPQAYLRISEIQRREGHYDDALTSLKKAKGMVSDSLEISYNEALIDDSLGRYQDAETILTKLVADSEHPSGQYSDSEKNNRSIFLDRLANLYREESKWQQAVDTYSKMVALGGEFAERGYQGEVDTYRDGKEYAKATQVARDAAAKMPKDRSIQLMLALQLADTGKPEEGVDLAKSLLKGNSDDREVELSLVQIYTRLHRWNDAAAELDKAEKMAVKPDDKVFVYFLRGAMEERQKHYDAAETEFRKVLAIDPNNSMTLNYLGYMLADRGTKLNEALKFIQKAVELDPQNYAYLDSLGWAQYKLGDYQKSEDSLRKATERNSGDPTVHDHLGDLYEKTGRLKLAAAQWEESLSEYAKTIAADAEPNDVSKVQKKLDSARVRLAKGETGTTVAKPQ
jgi:tetratricopeptide (TPR) repeat protein